MIQTFWNVTVKTQKEILVLSQIMRPNYYEIEDTKSQALYRCDARCLFSAYTGMYISCIFRQKDSVLKCFYVPV